jgi:hypothetical protein
MQPCPRFPLMVSPLGEFFAHIRKWTARLASQPRGACGIPLSSADAARSRPGALLFVSLVYPVSSWIYCPAINRAGQALCSATNFSTSRKSNRIGPPLVKRMHGNSPLLTLRRTVILLTARSFDTSEMLSRGVTALRLPFLYFSHSGSTS